MKSEKKIEQPQPTINHGALLLVVVLLGIMSGVGGFTFYIGEGLSYFSKDPAACKNCHIMNPQYNSWQKSSHHTVATCVDCHLPQDFIGKYIAKAENGYHHSRAFTMQDFHEPILIKPKNSRILKENCVTCHSELAGDIIHAAAGKNEENNCLHCHHNAGHGETAGIGGPLRQNEIGEFNE